MGLTPITACYYFYNYFFFCFKVHLCKIFSKTKIFINILLRFLIFFLSPFFFLDCLRNFLVVFGYSFCSVSLLAPLFSSSLCRSKYFFKNAVCVCTACMCVILLFCFSISTHSLQLTSKKFLSFRPLHAIFFALPRNVEQRRVNRQQFLSAPVFYCAFSKAQNSSLFSFSTSSSQLLSSCSFHSSLNSPTFFLYPKLLFPSSSFISSPFAASCYRFSSLRGRGRMIDMSGGSYCLYKSGHDKNRKSETFLNRMNTQDAQNEITEKKEVPSVDPVDEYKKLAYSWRKEFPALKEKVYDKDLVYFDNAATSHKPLKVINCLTDFYKHYNSNVHRGAHALSLKATEQYEGAREKLKNLINAEKNEEVIFTYGATDAINLVANTWGEENIKEDDVILLSKAEHHSNLVPWQMLAKRKKAKLKFLNLTEDEECVDIEELKKILKEGGVKLICLNHFSNVLGSICNIKLVTSLAHLHQAKILIDACQSIPHTKVDVQDVKCDFLVASSHKMCGPNGVGILYAKSSILEDMPPYRGGGAMIQDVYLHSSTYASPPCRWEAGTPPIAEAIAFGAAADFLENEVGFQKMEEYEKYLSEYLYEKLSSEVRNIRIYGPKITRNKQHPPVENTGGSNSDGGDSQVGHNASHNYTNNNTKFNHNASRILTRANLVSFCHNVISAYDLAVFLNYEGIAVRAGHHCAQPLHRDVLLVPGSLRASLYFYNTPDEIDRFVESLKSVIKSLEGIESSQKQQFDDEWAAQQTV